jgi:hypothetical protein
MANIIKQKMDSMETSQKYGCSGKDYRGGIALDTDKKEMGGN